MNKNPISKLTYGVYIVSSKYRDKANACVIDTCMQVGTNPDRIAISLMNTNYTKKIIKESGVFCVSILDETCPFGLIYHFGYKKGVDMDKFADIPAVNDINGVPYVLSNSCAYISAKVVEYINLGSHTIFIGKVKDSGLLNNNKPLTYDIYQSMVKPQLNTDRDNSPNISSDMPASAMPETKSVQTETATIDDKNSNKKIIGWRCTICGYEYDKPELPDDFTCPVCGHPKEDFEPIYE